MMIRQLLVLLITLAVILLCRSADLPPELFQKTVIEDDRVWLIEFYSPMCGSCTEFAPTWNAVEAGIKNIATGKINIDVKEGMEIASKLGVLDEGLPNIRLFTAKNKGISIHTGEGTPTPKKIIAKVRKNTTGFSRRDDGFYQKSQFN